MRSTYISQRRRSVRLNAAHLRGHLSPPALRAAAAAGPSVCPPQSLPHHELLSIYLLQPRAPSHQQLHPAAGCADAESVSQETTSNLLFLSNTSLVPAEVNSPPACPRARVDIRTPSRTRASPTSLLFGDMSTSSGSSWNCSQ